MHADRLLRPVLVGGTGRSGSTIVGHLLDHHPDLTLSRPMEVRFIAGNDGVADALAVASRAPGSPSARAAAALAVDRLRNRWFERAADVGLHTSMTREQVEAWSDDYLGAFDLDALAATRLLVTRIMNRIAERLGATRLVDTTPANARKADRLEPIYPDSRVVIVTRDGRDVAASFVSQPFGPDDVFVALDQWEKRMLRSHRAAAASRPERVLAIELIDLVVSHRSGTLRAALRLRRGPRRCRHGRVVRRRTSRPTACIRDAGDATSTRTPARASTRRTSASASGWARRASRSPPDSDADSAGASCPLPRPCGYISRNN